MGKKEELRGGINKFLSHVGGFAEETGPRTCGLLLKEERVFRRKKIDKKRKTV